MPGHLRRLGDILAGGLRAQWDSVQHCRPQSHCHIQAGLAKAPSSAPRAGTPSSQTLQSHIYPCSWAGSCDPSAMSLHESAPQN